MLKALGDTFIADCETKLGASEVDCALNAVDTTAACALALNVKNANSNASYETKLVGALVELL